MYYKYIYKYKYKYITKNIVIICLFIFNCESYKIYYIIVSVSADGYPLQRRVSESKSKCLTLERLSRLIQCTER